LGLLSTPEGYAALSEGGVVLAKGYAPAILSPGVANKTVSIDPTVKPMSRNVTAVGRSYSIWACISGRIMSPLAMILLG
jgi:hypothetical protein